MKPSKLSTISSSRLEYIRDSPQYDWRNMFIATLLGWSISSQVDIKIDQVFMENSSTLFQFSKALYPRRVAVMPSFEGASEIAPNTIKKTGYNLIKTNAGFILLDFHNDGIVAITFQTKIGEILVWESGKTLE